ncbi:HD domain-containing protein [Clostridium vitabionis]|uniref:HD domain-containing protein n=1 Tax=Clostridium vitabionis TaxID=2784388 RepID=UPI00188A34A5|nr:HD domain-containing protein [Clostridium vitabionis]
MTLRLSDETVLFAREHSEITENPAYRRLAQIPRHGCTNTYDHSIRVAYLAEKMAPKLGVDPESAARVGFLHDFCFVNYHEAGHEDHEGLYCFYHPVEAVENSELYHYELTEVEKKAIRCHMFPLATSVPTSRLACVLTLSDKIVATYESACNLASAANRVKLLFHHLVAEG